MWRRAGTSGERGAHADAVAVRSVKGDNHVTHLMLERRGTKNLACILYFSFNLNSKTNN